MYAKEDIEALQRRDQIAKAYLEASNKCMLMQTVYDDILLDLKKMVAEYAQEMDTRLFEELVMPLLFESKDDVIAAYHALLLDFSDQTFICLDDVARYLGKRSCKTAPNFCMRPACCYKVCTCPTPLVWLWHPIHERRVLHGYPLRPDYT